MKGVFYDSVETVVELSMSAMLTEWSEVLCMEEDPFLTLIFKQFYYKKVGVLYRIL